ncbi:MAG: DUF4924 family protein [Bacteroidales bacterium]|nr:DUF4924 family protein [Bacteroidales bacterium]
MLVASQKRKENIAEYLLYMFQVEDLIRSFNFDIEAIDKSLITQYREDYSFKREIREWYRSLIVMMKESGVQNTGHIPLLRGLINSLNDIHLSLLQKENEHEYSELYSLCNPAIEELRIKSGDPDTNDIEVCLNGLYGLLLLRMQKKIVNPETQQAFERISKLLVMVSRRFHEVESGEKEF